MTFEQERIRLRLGSKGAKIGRQAFVRIIEGQLYREAGYETADAWLKANKDDRAAVQEIRWTHNGLVDRLKVVRELYPAGWTQEGLGDLLGVGQGLISDDLKGLDIEPRTDRGGRPREPAGEDISSDIQGVDIRVAMRTFDSLEKKAADWHSIVDEATPEQAAALLEEIPEELVDEIVNLVRRGYLKLRLASEPKPNLHVIEGDETA